MNELTPVENASAPPSDGFEWLATLNDGFLGTGSSTMVELSYIVMALIVGYLAIATARYFFSGRKIAAVLAEALGLR